MSKSHLDEELKAVLEKNRDYESAQERFSSEKVSRQLQFRICRSNTITDICGIGSCSGCFPIYCKILVLSTSKIIGHINHNVLSMIIKQTMNPFIMKQNILIDTLFVMC